VGISRNWAPFVVSLGTVMAPVGVSSVMLMCYGECILRVHDIVQEGVTKTIPKKKCKKGKMAVRGGLTRRRRKEKK